MRVAGPQSVTQNSQPTVRPVCHSSPLPLHLTLLFCPAVSLCGPHTYSAVLFSSPKCSVLFPEGLYSLDRNSLLLGRCILFPEGLYPLDRNSLLLGRCILFPEGLYPLDRNSLLLDRCVLYPEGFLSLDRNSLLLGRSVLYPEGFLSLERNSVLLGRSYWGLELHLCSQRVAWLPGSFGGILPSW